MLGLGVAAACGAALSRGSGEACCGAGDAAALGVRAPEVAGNKAPAKIDKARTALRKRLIIRPGIYSLSAAPKPRPTTDQARPLRSSSRRCIELRSAGLP